MLLSPGNIFSYVYFYFSTSEKEGAIGCVENIQNDPGNENNKTPALNNLYAKNSVTRVAARDLLRCEGEIFRSYLVSRILIMRIIIIYV